MKPFDIAPFGLPNCAPGEFRFEEPRDISEVLLTFKSAPPKKIGLSYLRHRWPEMRVEALPDQDDPCHFGWVAQDDWFNGQWHKAAITTKPVAKNAVSIGFKGIATEFPKMRDYDVAFRRTLGICLDGFDPESLRKVVILTRSETAQTTLSVQLDAGRKTRGKSCGLCGYNAVIKHLSSSASGSAGRKTLSLKDSGKRTFDVTVEHMTPAHRYSHDEGLVTFELDRDAFTISLESLRKLGPIWFEPMGVYVTDAQNDIPFDAYRKSIKGTKTIAERVRERPEQTFLDAFLGQPRPHAVSYNVGCKHNRHRFWIEANGDIMLRKANVTWVRGKDTDRFKTQMNSSPSGEGARFSFGLEQWIATARFSDSAPVLAFNVHGKKGNVRVQQKSIAVPLMRSIFDENLAGDDTCVCLVRFRFQNTGSVAEEVRLPIGYSSESGRSAPSLRPRHDRADKLFVRDNRIESLVDGKPVLRCSFETAMKPETHGDVVVMTEALQPGQETELLLKIPFIALESLEELNELDMLDFDACYEDVCDFWRQEEAKGAQLKTPVEPLNALHKAHVSHVQITDFRMPDEPSLINTSVGTSTYGNFSNESCMIVQELDQRGLHEDARRRLELWLKYQGTAEQPGNFTDYDGMFFGAGGFEQGAYNQHHGWVLWCLCEHLFLTGDRTWFESIADKVIAGADWVFRQRRNTMKPLSHSRGWEYGFLPAGSLEDVTDFHYWLSTNSLTWRGTEWAACALEHVGHPEASRVREEANAYREDLVHGFETMRRHSPLVRLRDGRWIPQYPSRLYCRGRDTGWIRQLLEGSVYLLISGLYDSKSVEASWILDDYQDNLYVQPPYGYLIPNFEANWYHRGGFSIQPNLLAGLLPYLERDEPEVYIWMFFNAWVACYREDINAMIEHPAPVLGYSNAAHFKTSDEANAVMWLRYMFVYSSGESLYLGRAIPRGWFAAEQHFELKGVSTPFGEVGVRYEPHLAQSKIRAFADLTFARKPKRILLRFRHPENKPVRSVSVDGKKHRRFNSETGDVDLTGFEGKVAVEATY